MVQLVTSYVAGVITGVLYASYKYDRNPNEIFNDWKDGASKASEAVKDKTAQAADVVKTKVEEVTAEMQQNKAVVDPAVQILTEGAVQ